MEPCMLPIIYRNGYIEQSQKLRDVTRAPPGSLIALRNRTVPPWKMANPRETLPVLTNESTNNQVGVRLSLNVEFNKGELGIPHHKI